MDAVHGSVARLQDQILFLWHSVLARSVFFGAMTPWNGLKKWLKCCQE